MIKSRALNMMKRLSALSLAALFAGMLGACGKSSPGGNSEFSEDAEGKGLKIVCTLFPQYDFLREITREVGQITLLLPPGVESHSYDPTPADMKAVSGADLIVRIGENMETWSDGLFEAAADSGAECLDIASSLGLSLAAHEHEEGEAHSENERDPHIWTDPLIACDMVELLCDKLCAMDKANAEKYRGNAEEYLEKLHTLDSEIKSAVESSGRKTVIFAGRFALRNFTERYNLQAVAAFDACADNSEPGAAVIARIIDVIERENIPAVFYEELVEPKTANVISESTGCDTLLFHSCHNLSRDEFDAGETYLSLMEQNLRNLREALA